MWNQCPPKSWRNNSFLGSVYIKFQSDFAQDWQSERYLSARVMMNGVPDGVNFLIFCLKGFEWPQEATSLPPCTVWLDGILGGIFVYNASTVPEIYLCSKLIPDIQNTITHQGA